MKAKMKVRIVIGLVFGLCFTLWGFQFKSATVKVVDFKEALQQNLISAELKSTGKYRGNSIGAQITNKGATALTIRIPAGSYFKAESDDEQSLLVTQDILVQLTPKSMSSKVLDGYCCNASKKCPTKGNKFTLSNNKVTHFDKVAALLKGKKYGNGVHQNVVWALSDNHALSNITADNPETVRSLREEIAKITGKKNEWYNSPQEETVDPFGNINRESVSVEGDIELTFATDVKVHQEIQDSVGNVLVKGVDSRPLHKGAVKYHFALQVKGWKKGTYYVKLMNGTQVLTKNEFKV